MQAFDWKEVLYWYKALAEIAEYDPASALGLVLAGIVVIMGAFYRSYRSKVLAAFYPFEINKLSLSFLVSAIVAVGVTAAARMGSSPRRAGLPFNRWAILLGCCFIIGWFLYFVSIDSLLRKEQQRQEHLIACVLGWALIGFKEKGHLRRRFTVLAKDHEKIDGGHQFTEAFSAGLKDFESTYSSPAHSGDTPESLLVRHISAERQLYTGWADWLIVLFQMLPPYLLVCVALHVIRLAVAGRS